MERCPTCNARYKGRSGCHRCGTDLARLLAIEKEAAEHRDNAVEAFNRQDFDAMYFHARRACALLRTPSAEKHLACAALVAGDPATALSTWKSYRRSQPNDTKTPR